jgi:hypothetical protein
MKLSDLLADKPVEAACRANCFQDEQRRRARGDRAYCICKTANDCGADMYPVDLDGMRENIRAAWEKAELAQDNPNAKAGSEVLDSSCAFADGWHDATKAPFGVWLLTHRLGEKGYNVTMRLNENEWADREGATTTTHHSFAAPTHFLWGKEAADAFIRKMNATPPPAADGMREALEKARVIVEKWCHYQGNSPALFAEYLDPIDAALQTAKERG